MPNLLLDEPTEPEQGCVEGRRALTRAGETVSTMVTTRLRDLYADTEPYAALPEVAELRNELRAAVSA